MSLALLSTDPGIAYGAAKGASIHLAQLAQALAAVGGDVHLLVTAVEPGSPPAPRGVTIEALPGPGRHAPTVDRIAFEPQLAAWLVRRLDELGATALYERLALHSAAGSRAVQELGIPHVVELNAPLREEAAAFRSLEQPEAAAELERATLEGAGLVLAVTRPLAAYATAHGALRVQVLPNAVDTDRFRPRTSEPAASPVAVFCGRLRPWHGTETIAEAWRLLGSGAPRLLVVGDGPGREALEAAGAEVTGPIPHADVPALLASAEIGLAPYARNGPRYFSPLKLFEYLAAGLAVVAGDLPGVADVVDERTAVVVPAGDPCALAEAISALAVDRERRARLGAAGSALVAAHHTWRHRAERVLAEVGELTAGSARRPDTEGRLPARIGAR